MKQSNFKNEKQLKCSIFNDIVMTCLEVNVFKDARISHYIGSLPINMSDVFT